MYIMYEFYTYCTDNFFPAGCLFIYDHSVTVVLIFLVVSKFLFVIYTVCTCFNDVLFIYST